MVLEDFPSSEVGTLYKSHTLTKPVSEVHGA